MFLDFPVGSLTEPISGRRWDRATIRDQVDQRIAANLHGGLQRGDRVFLHNGNRLEFFADLCAVWRLGAVVVPIDGRLTAFEVEALARTARPRLSIWSDAPDPGVAKALADLGVRVVDSRDRAGNARGVATSLGESARTLDEPALILFTSGTTGDPKGVVHTHRSLRARWISLRQSLGLPRFRRTLCLLPTHFGHGLICNCLFPWLSGADLFILPPFRPDIVADLGRVLDEHEITFLSSVPPVWRLALRLARRPTRGTLERVFCGSAPLSASLWTDIQEWTGTQEVWNAYGITETGSWVAGSSQKDLQPQDGLIGEPWGAVIKILRSSAMQPHPSLHGECAPGEAGYIWINTPGLMEGYFRRDDLTRQVVSDGWFMTGDLGFLDDRGHLILRGRERDEINKGGMKVFPADVDAVLETLPGVTDVCAFGYDGDPLYGENVGVAVVVSEASDERLRQLYRSVGERLASHQMPVRWYLVDAIPRTSRGKVNRSQVAESCGRLTALEWRRILQGEP